MDCTDTAKQRILDSISAFKSTLDAAPVNNVEDVLGFLREVPALIANFIQAVDAYCALAKPSKQKYFSVVVYLTQYCSTYELYRNTQNHHRVEKEVIFEIKRCICKRLTLLLEDADLIFTEEDDAAVGSFLTLMDLALDKIAEVDVKKQSVLISDDLDAAQAVIEEILCLAMSVAQVACNEDNKIITAGCRSVLNNLENLRTEIDQENRNIAMCNLVIDTCTDALCALEARVNTAVLRLCLNVFSQYKKPLKNLYDSSKHSSNADVDEIVIPLVADFDLHVDRIFQIGLFSVASSAVGKRVADIKNVIANLEFLEGELVPAILAMIKDHLPYRKQFADALNKSWCAQVKSLRIAVHGIVEPSAYCKLVYEELKQDSETIWQHIAAGKNVQKDMIDPFLNYTEELGHMITACMDSFDASMKVDVKKQAQVVYNVMKELKASRDFLLCEYSEERNEEANRKIFKRCQILVTTIKRLWFSTIEDEHKKNEIESDTDKQEKTIVTLHSLVGKSVEHSDPVLESIITKSKRLVKDRSMCTFNQTFILHRILKENTIQRSNGNKKLNLTTTVNARNYSYRQHGKVIEEDYKNAFYWKLRQYQQMKKLKKYESLLETENSRRSRN